jgi:hypothetical protein
MDMNLGIEFWLAMKCPPDIQVSAVECKTVKKLVKLYSSPFYMLVHILEFIWLKFDPKMLNVV